MIIQISDFIAVSGARVGHHRSVNICRGTWHSRTNHSPILQIISQTEINLRCESFVFSPLLTSLSTYRDLISLPLSIDSFHQVISIDTYLRATIFCN